MKNWNRPKTLPQKETNTPISEPTFAEIVCRECSVLMPGQVIDPRHPEALSAFDYGKELEIKNSAVRMLLSSLNPGQKLQEIVPSPKPRHYRTTSKRRWISARSRASFVMANGQSIRSLLDPELHTRIYEFAANQLSLPKNRALSAALSYLIIRGDYSRFSLIFNLNAVDGAIVRNLRFFADTLRAEFSGIVSCFMYLDEKNSDYYLERERPEKKVAIKKIFGSELMDVTLDGKKMLYPVTAFSQINLSMLETFTGTAFRMLDLKAGDTLLDLYCGYGLFGLTAADKCARVLGIDYAGEAIQSAEKIAAHLYPGKPVRFIRGDITPELLKSRLPAPSPGDRIILDPPRSGCLPGIIETLASRKAGRILHIFCGTDTMKKELSIWLNNGWKIDRIVPLDLFPGTINLETLVLLKR